MESTPEARSAERFLVTFNPAQYALDLENLCIQSGVDVVYDTRLCTCIVNSGVVEAVVVENKSGRFAIAGGSFVDATGDADLCFAAGVATETLDSNVRAGWYYYTSKGAVKLRALSRPFTRDASRIDDDNFYRGDDGLDVTRQTLDSRDLLRDDWERIREKDPDAKLLRLSDVPGFRMTRRMVGESTIVFEDSGRVYDDGVCWFPSWREAGPVWHLRFSSLYASAVKNVAAAGRCMSASSAAWDIARAIPVCALTGEVAGTASALLSATGIQGFDALAIDTLQERLSSNGNIVEPDETWV
jgi:hypothetical protein